jgi:hypothetical protein
VKARAASAFFAPKECACLSFVPVLSARARDRFPRLGYGSSGSNTYTSDGVHPTVDGAQIIADAWLRVGWSPAACPDRRLKPPLTIPDTLRREPLSLSEL